MIKGRLEMALDFAKPRRKKGEPPPTHAKWSYLADGTWFVVQEGPGYRNVHEVTEYDDAGLAWLQANEVKPKESPNAQ